MTAGYDVVIAGGGPAGCAAAIRARQLGARVLLFERGRYPRHKVCGEFLSADGLATLQPLLAAAEMEVLNTTPRIAHARLFVDERLLETRLDPPSAGISRFDLDHLLWRSAERAGADARQQTAVAAVEGEGPFVVKTSAGAFTARAVVDASGRWSALHSADDYAAATHDKWLGLKAHFLEADTPASVDLYFFKGGYCGVQPVGQGRLNACAMVRAQAASTLEQVFAAHPLLWRRSRAWEPASEVVTTAPLLFRHPEPVRSGMLCAGDAAGFIDPFVGDGISLALAGGALAAECLAPLWTANGTLADCARRYRQQYQRRFLPAFRHAARMRRLTSLAPALRAPLLSLLRPFLPMLLKKTRAGASRPVG